MRGLKDLLFHNWFLKLLSLALAAVLWMSVASESTSEIGIQVPVEYKNVPISSEIIAENADAVEVRLRGPSRLIREISSQDISTTIDVEKITPGEKIVPLTPQNVSAPFGVEVVAVTPSRVRLTVEHTITKTVPVVPLIVGEPAEGFRVVRSTVTPASVEVQGPETRVQALDRVPTTLVDISAKEANVQATVELDPAEPLVRIQRAGPVHVEVVISPR